ncbi:Cysteine-rich secretory protein family protein [Paraburkholderia fungorum]|uniref:Cysteine-rich secretory protein family protein n=1 Tax=Paraburkholderia fungorum TaxID=134537 RepID=A0A1H1JX82_9BURK|nr:CAP domain-containing protein [Paraburkholderia fungorum]SDR54380.1 Cysteine-rich secretory protein family protein [Paraburkholderia fungorum]
MKNNNVALSAISIAAVLTLAACGGGGGGGNSGEAAPSTGASTPTATATGANVATPQYATDSAQLAAFNTLNQQRQSCGFPALVENTQLDQAAQAHASYMGQNGGQITDTEVVGNPGFTGVTYTDRAVHFGFPSATTTYSGGVSGGYYTNATLTDAAYGQQLAYDWLSGVYHIAVGVWPVTAIGVGFNQTTYNSFPEIQASLLIANFTTMSNVPLTFPCQGTSGVAYLSGGETPTPPNVSGNWGTPIAVAGNSGDTIALIAGTVTDASGNVTTLQLLDSANDPNKVLPKYEAVAYPATPLLPNTSYSVSLAGTVNGTAFSRNFTFTTGNIVG